MDDGWDSEAPPPPEDAPATQFGPPDDRPGRRVFWWDELGHAETADGPLTIAIFGFD